MAVIEFTKGDQCAAGSCTKRKAGGAYCGGRVCTRTSESLFGSSEHTNVRQARRDARLGIDPLTQEMMTPFGRDEKPEKEDSLFGREVGW